MKSDTWKIMEYIKVNCTLSSDSEIARELLMAELGNIGFESFVETDEGIEAYVPSKDFSSEFLASDNLQNNDFFKFNYTYEVIADQNWNEIWEQNYFEPLLIEDQCMIRAPFHSNYPAAKYEIIINLSCPLLEWCIGFSRISIIIVVNELMATNATNGRMNKKNNAPNLLPVGSKPKDSISKDIMEIKVAA